MNQKDVQQMVGSVNARGSKSEGASRNGAAISRRRQAEIETAGDGGLS
jgi:hypothetical protein